jgi:hypothetical protein
MALSQVPQFAELFPVCRCGRDTCDRCCGFQMTPRTAAVLWSLAQVLADNGYDDVEEHGSDPMRDEGSWSLFNRYPRVTWGQDAVWRRQAARAYDDLAFDENGGWPLPTCPAEEMALHMILEDVPHTAEDGWTGLNEPNLASLAEHPGDFDWDAMPDVLLQDTDVLHLFEPDLDGIEDPNEELNLDMAMGDYRPSAWFKAFANMQPRDEQRPFRR